MVQCISEQTFDNVLIYGASTKGKQYLPAITQYFKVIGFLDSDRKKHGSQFLGYDVHHPEQVDIPENCLVIIASTYEQEISDYLRRQNIVQFDSVHNLTRVEATYRKIYKESKQKQVAQLSKSNPLKVSVGSEGIAENDWIVTEQSFLDVTKMGDWSACFEPDSLDVIFAEHVWEHMTEQDAQTATRNCYHFLKPGGTLRIAVPDGFHESETYIQEVKPGGFGNGSDDHKQLFNFISLRKLLEEAGFKVKLLEYFDENKCLHTNHIENEKGHVRRSVHTYPWNGTNKINYRYSSLVIDGIK